MTTKIGLEPGSNARVYRDGIPGEGVLVCMVHVPVGRPLELRNLNPGTYCVADELGNTQEFVVSAVAESAWVPVRGAEMALGGSAGPGQAVFTAADPVGDPGVERAPAPRHAARPIAVDPDTQRVPGAPGSAIIGDPQGEPLDAEEDLEAPDEAPGEEGQPTMRQDAMTADERAPEPDERPERERITVRDQEKAAEKQARPESRAKAAQRQKQAASGEKPKRGSGGKSRS